MSFKKHKIIYIAIYLIAMYAYIMPATAQNGTQISIEQARKQIRQEKTSDIMVVVEADGSRVALLVDELLGQQQVVVKNLESNYRKVPNVSGATILGDGKVALILDTGALVRHSRH